MNACNITLPRGYLIAGDSVGSGSFRLAVSSVPVIGEEVAAFSHLADHLAYLDRLDVGRDRAQIVAWVFLVEGPTSHNCVGRTVLKRGQRDFSEN